MKKLAMGVIGVLLSSGMSISFAAPGASSNQRVYPGVDKAKVWQSVMLSLAQQDLPVVTADFDHGKIRARQHDYLNTAWAHCAPGYRRSFDPTHASNLRVRSAPLYRGVDLKLDISETAEGTTLSLDPSYTNVGRDTQRREFAFQTPCRSTGILEQILFAAPGDAG